MIVPCSLSGYNGSERQHSNPKAQDFKIGIKNIFIRQMGILVPIGIPK